MKKILLLLICTIAIIAFYERVTTMSATSELSIESPIHNGE
jgi:hypothetical protein